MSAPNRKPADLDLQAPPHDLESEAAVIGSILADPSVLDELTAILRVEDFYHHGNGQFFGACQSLQRSGVPVDAVTLANAIGEKLDECGGLAQLTRCIEAVPHASHARYYGDIVAGHSGRRQLMETGRAIIRDSHDRSADVGDLCANARQRIDRIADGNGTEEPVSAAEGVKATFEELMDESRSVALSTGYAEWDGLTAGGFRPGELIIIAARPGMGKTALGINVGGKAAAHGTPVLFFSLEMSKTELFQRLISSVSNIPHEQIRKMELDEMEQFAVSEASTKVSAWPFYVDDKARRTVSQIAAVSRRFKRKRGLGLVIVDYLSLVASEDPKLQREQQIANITRALKVLAKDDLKIPIICLAQLNRELERREDKRPKLSDLRESGAIEQDADLVAFVDRPAEYDADAHPSDASLFVRKNRHGDRGQVALHWRATTMTFFPPVSVMGGSL